MGLHKGLYHKILAVRLSYYK